MFGEECFVSVCMCIRTDTRTKKTIRTDHVAGERYLRDQLADYGYPRAPVMLPVLTADF